MAAAPARPQPVRTLVTIAGPSEDIAVPFTKLTLTNGEELLLSTVEGAHPGLAVQPQLRAPWINQRVGDKHKTQLDYAKAGIVTKEMEYAAVRESFGCGPDMPFTSELVRQEIAAGRAVLPCNRLHPECEPMVIGRRFSVKVNANIGASALSSDLQAEIAKLHLALKFGADTVMDLSAGVENLAQIRTAILRASPVPIGTVPVYEALDRAHGDPSLLTWEFFRQVIIDQAEQGVDYFTIHAGLTQDLLPYAAARLMGIVSRGGSIMASAMLRQNAENLAWAHFDELMDICRQYDVALSLGDGLRPGALADACDKAQYGELKNIGRLAARCREAGVQCFIEGPGHVPLDRVYENQDLEDQYCGGAPFYTLGPLVSDIAPGYDHITSAIGGSLIAYRGTSMLCYVTPSEHLALPTAEDVKVGLITFKLAAHAADVAKKLPGAQRRDDAMSRARAEFRWYDQFALSLDPEHAEAVWKSQMPDDCAHEPSFCSMCGPRFCPIRLNRKLKAVFENKD